MDGGGREGGKDTYIRLEITFLIEMFCLSSLSLKDIANLKHCISIQPAMQDSSVIYTPCSYIRMYICTFCHLALHGIDYCTGVIYIYIFFFFFLQSCAIGQEC